MDRGYDEDAVAGPGARPWPADDPPRGYARGPIDRERTVRPAVQPPRDESERGPREPSRHSAAGYRVDVDDRLRRAARATTSGPGRPRARAARWRSDARLGGDALSPPGAHLSL